MSNGKPIIATDASKTAKPAASETPAAPEVRVAEKDLAAKMTAGPTAKPVDASPVKKF